MPTTDASPKPVAEPKSESAPLLLDLGRQKAKAVKQLRKGTGRLLDDVLSTIDELKTVGTISPTAQPVIVLVQENPTTKSLFPVFVK